MTDKSYCGLIAIVGRPNVGKSTLFNRIIGRRKAITHDEPGVTRDLNYADVEEGGRSFTLIDTGGFEADTSDVILAQVREQARLAIEDSDLIVFVMDNKAGPAPDDTELIDILRRSGKPVVYAVNKIDTARQEAGLADFYRLGVGELLPVSAEHGRGVNELIDEVLKRLPEAAEEEEAGERTKIAIVGRPNVGKSSLLNRITGKRRAIVSAVAGTTRDSIDTPFDLDGRKYLFIDTAGIRKKNKVSLTVENYSVVEAIKSIDRCDCAVLVIDGKSGITTQDEKIAGLMDERHRCAIVAVNKWDLVEKDHRTADYVKDTVRAKLPFLAYAPVVFTSALTGQKVPKLLDTIDRVVDKSRTRIQTSVLNKVLEGLYARFFPPAYRGKEVKFYYITQGGVAPVTFLVFTNLPEGVTDAYRRYMINGLREALSLDEIPIRLTFRKRQ